MKINLNEIDFKFFHTLHTDNKKQIEKLSLTRTATNSESAEIILEGYINFLTQEVKDLYMKKGLRKYIGLIEIAAYGGIAKSHEWDSMNFITPEISFCIEKAPYTVLVITKLMDHFVLKPRQNKRIMMTERIERYLKETKLVD